MSNTASLNRIIIAEDNAADVGLVREALSEHEIEHELFVMKDGEQAIAYIELLESDENVPCPDLLLLDLHLPRRDGEDVLKRLRSSTRCGQTPVIVMTSSDSPHDHAAAEKHAALHYFRKPSDLGQFMQLGFIIKQIIARKPAETLKEVGPSLSATT